MNKETAIKMTLTSKVMVTLLGLSLAFLAQLNVLDDIGLKHTQAGLERALVTYGVSRGLNGIISVVQGTEVAIEPVGIGMTFTPGQILDPVNDLIERFSTVVLVSGTAFGLQRVLIDVVSAPLFSIAVSLMLLLALMIMWGRRGLKNWGFYNQRVSAFLCRSALIFVIIRFSIPLAAILSENVYEYFLASSYQQSSQTLISTTDQLQKIQQKTDAVSSSVTESKSLLDSARDLYYSTANKLDMQQHIDDFKQAAENISEHAIQLIVVFVFQTLLLPLVSVWLTLKAIKCAALGRIKSH